MKALPLSEVEIYAIGDELLIGRTLETNAHRLAQGLHARGLSLRQIRVIPDEAEVIRRCLDDCRAGVAITTGGLGATEDDCTRRVLAEWLGVPLMQDAEVLARLRTYYEKRGRTLNPISEKMSFVPQGAEVLLSDAGAAPGLRINRPDEGTLFALPGVPWEVDHLAERHLWPWLEANAAGGHVEQRVFRTVGVPESKLAGLLADFEAKLPPDVKLAYNPSLHSLDLRLVLATSRADWPDRKREYEGLAEDLRQTVAPYIYGVGDETLEAAVGAELKARGLTVALAESCTGGALAARLVSVAGASAWVRGGVVAYDNALKTQLLGVSEDLLREHGAVSEPVARAMAEGARLRLGADLGLSTTGIAGPDGGSDEKPVGTVWMAVADAKGTAAERHLFERDRGRNIGRSVAAALDLLRRRLAEAM